MISNVQLAGRASESSGLTMLRLGKGAFSGTTDPRLPQVGPRSFRISRPRGSRRPPAGVLAELLVGYVAPLGFVVGIHDEPLIQDGCLAERFREPPVLDRVDGGL